MRSIRRILRTIPILIGLLLLFGLILALVARRDETVEARGEVRVAVYQVVRPRVAGLVTGVLVESGAAVRPGQNLVTLEDYDLRRDSLAVERQLLEARSALGEARRRGDVLTGRIQPVEARKETDEIGRAAIEIERKEARVRELQVELETLRSRQSRSEDLSKAGLLSVDQLDEARSQVRQAEWRLQQGKLEVDEAKAARSGLVTGRDLLGGQQAGQRIDAEAQVKDLELRVARLEGQLRELHELATFHTLRATVAGVVVGPAVEDLVGRRPAAGEELFQVIDPASIAFLAHVPEEEIVKVRPGQKVYVEVAGLPKCRFDVFRGRVRKIGQQPRLVESQGRIYYDVEIALDTPWVPLERGRFYLRNGMRGDVDIVYREDVTFVRSIYDFLVGSDAG